MNELKPLASDDANGDFVAAADLGSNSFHLLIGKREHGRLVIVDRLRDIVRIAGGFDENLNLTEQAQERALASLSRLGQRLQDIPSENIRAVATNAFRRAHNAQQFIKKAEKALGHQIEIITGHEEARLIYTSVSFGMSNQQEKLLVVDIGGGSTEIIAGTGPATVPPPIVESLYIGCVSLSQDHFADGKINRDRLQQAEMDAKLEVRGRHLAFQNHGWDRVVGCSGTIRAVATALEHLGWGDGGSITPPALFKLLKKVGEQKRVEKLESIGFDPDRCEVLPGGIAILCAVFDLLEIDRMEVSEQALREGVIYDLIGRLYEQDAREDTVHALTNLWAIDVAHADKVRATAITIFEQVAPMWEIDLTEAKNVLSWAAQLHEIGLSISHAQYHRHGAYLLENSELAGFSRPEQTALARLVRGHRRKFPVKDFKTPTHLRKSVMRKLCVILRLAVLLHRSRTNREFSGTLCWIDGKRFHISFPSGWLDEHPLTSRDLAREREYLKAVDIDLIFGHNSESDHESRSMP